MHKKRTIKGTLFCALLAIACLGLSGCLLKAPDALYALPRQSESYYELESEIEKLLTSGVSYCAPTGGENRQPLQMQDLDGDGKNEALVFAKDAEETHPLKIFILAQKDGAYSLVSTIEGNGTSFDSVCYAEMDGSPGLEIVIGRSISDQVTKSVSVYTFQQNSTVELVSANYSLYTTVDLDLDGRKDLFLVRFDSELHTGNAELYRYSEGVMVRDPEQRLSCGTDTICRVVTGFAEASVPAVFVASNPDEGQLVTDVFAVRDGTLQNLAANETTGNLTVRNYNAYATDIDGDGLIELPDVLTLPDQAGGDGKDDFRLIHWFNLALDGTKQYKLLTYHDYSHGIYLELPDAWLGQITISQEETGQGGVGYVFHRWQGSAKPTEEIFTLYLFSGDDRRVQAQTEPRFFLADKNEISYAASLGSSAWSAQLGEDALRQRFHFIQVAWNSGEM